MAIYRKDWTSEATGWNFRLDIVPYDTDLDGVSVDAGIKNLSGNDVTVTEIGMHSTKFDKLPYGLKSPDTLSVTLAYSNLPTALQTALRNKVETNYGMKNTFLLYSSRAVGGSPTYLEFAGTPSKINSINYKHESGTWLTTVELVDMLYDAMINTPMSGMASMPTTGNRLTKFTDIPDFRFLGVDVVSLKHLSDYETTGWAKGFYVDSFANLVSYAMQLVSNTLALKYCHRTELSQPKVADYASQAADFIGTTITYFKSNSAYPRTAGTAFTPSTAMLVSHIVDNTNKVIGGICAKEDEVGWGRYETAWDWYKDLCECMGAKVSFYPSTATISSKTYIVYNWDIKPVKADRSGTVQTLDFGKSLTWPEIAETEDGIGKVECRTQTFRDTDAKEYVVNAGVMRADQQFTSQIAITNMPVMVSDKFEVVEETGNANFYSSGLYQTNRICWAINSTEAELAHTKVRLYEDAATYTDYNPVVGGVDLGVNIPKVSAGDAQDQELQLYLNAVQINGCTAIAIAKHIAKLFGNDNIASFSAEFRITDYPTLIRNVNLCGVYDLSGSDIASEFPHLNWARAVTTEIETDYNANRSKIKFLLVP